MSEASSTKWIAWGAGGATLAALAVSFASWRALRSVEQQLEKVRAPAAETQIATAQPRDLVKRADAVVADDPRTAAALYEEAIAGLHGDERQAERLAAQLGLARARAALSEGSTARTILRAAMLSTGRPERPHDLVELAEAATKAGEHREARRLYYSALALEGRAGTVKAEREALARAALGVGETYEAEAREAPTIADAAATASTPNTDDRQTRITWLEDVDPNAAPAASVALGERGEPRATVRAERSDARALLALVAERAGRRLVLPERTREEASAGTTAELADVPLDTAVRVLAGVAGLEVAAVDSSDAAEATIRLEAPRAADGSMGRARARLSAEAAYLASLRWTGVESSRAHLQLGELAREAARFEDAIGHYKEVLSIAPRSPEASKALLGIARSESALLRFGRCRDALFQLVSRPQARDLAPAAMLLVADSYAGEGRDGDSEKSLRQLLATFPESKEAKVARLHLAHLLASEHQHEAALEAFRELARPGAEPGLLAEASTGAARELLALGRPAEAASLLAPLLARRAAEDRTPEAYTLFGRALHEAGRHLPALLAFRQLHGQFVGTPEAREAAALVAREEVEVGLLDEAALALADPEAGAAAPRLELARAWLEAGQPGRARTLVDPLLRAAKETEGHVAVVLLAARCDEALGDPGAALRVLVSLRGRTLAPAEAAEAAGIAGRAELALGHRDRAIRAFREGALEQDEPATRPAAKDHP